MDEAVEASHAIKNRPDGDDKLGEVGLAEFLGFLAFFGLVY